MLPFLALPLTCTPSGMMDEHGSSPSVTTDGVLTDQMDEVLEVCAIEQLRGLIASFHEIVTDDMEGVLALRSALRGLIDDIFAVNYSRTCARSGAVGIKAKLPCSPRFTILGLPSSGKNAVISFVTCENFSATLRPQGESLQGDEDDPFSMLFNQSPASSGTTSPGQHGATSPMRLEMMHAYDDTSSLSLELSIDNHNHNPLHERINNPPRRRTNNTMEDDLQECASPSNGSSGLQQPSPHIKRSKFASPLSQGRRMTATSDKMPPFPPPLHPRPSGFRRMSPEANTVRASAVIVSSEDPRPLLLASPNLLDEGCCNVSSPMTQGTSPTCRSSCERGMGGSSNQRSVIAKLSFPGGGSRHFTTPRTSPKVSVCDSGADVYVVATREPAERSQISASPSFFLRQGGASLVDEEPDGETRLRWRTLHPRILRKTIHEKVCQMSSPSPNAEQHRVSSSVPAVWLAEDGAAESPSTIPPSASLPIDARSTSMEEGATTGGGGGAFPAYEVPWTFIDSEQCALHSFGSSRMAHRINGDVLLVCIPAVDVGSPLLENSMKLLFGVFSAGAERGGSQSSATIESPLSDEGHLFHASPVVVTSAANPAASRSSAFRNVRQSMASQAIFVLTHLEALKPEPTAAGDHMESTGHPPLFDFISGIQKRFKQQVQEVYGVTLNEWQIIPYSAESCQASRDVLVAYYQELRGEEFSAYDSERFTEGLHMSTSFSDQSQQIAAAAFDNVVTEGKPPPLLTLRSAVSHYCEVHGGLYADKLKGTGNTEEVNRLVVAHARDKMWLNSGAEKMVQVSRHVHSQSTTYILSHAATCLTVWATQVLPLLPQAASNAEYRLAEHQTSLQNLRDQKKILSSIYNDLKLGTCSVSVARLQDKLHSAFEKRVHCFLREVRSIIVLNEDPVEMDLSSSVKLSAAYERFKAQVTKFRCTCTEGRIDVKIAAVRDLLVALQKKHDILVHQYYNRETCEEASPLGDTVPVASPNHDTISKLADPEFEKEERELKKQRNALERELLISVSQMVTEIINFFSAYIAEAVPKLMLSLKEDIVRTLDMLHRSRLTVEGCVDALASEELTFQRLFNGAVALQMSESSKEVPAFFHPPHMMGVDLKTVIQSIGSVSMLSLHSMKSFAEFASAFRAAVCEDVIRGVAKANAFRSETRHPSTSVMETSGLITILPHETTDGTTTIEEVFGVHNVYKRSLVLSRSIGSPLPAGASLPGAEVAGQPQQQQQQQASQGKMIGATGKKRAQSASLFTYEIALRTAVMMKKWMAASGSGTQLPNNIPRAPPSPQTVPLTFPEKPRGGSAVHNSAKVQIRLSKNEAQLQLPSQPCTTNSLNERLARWRSELPRECKPIRFSEQPSLWILLDVMDEVLLSSPFFPWIRLDTVVYTNKVEIAIGHLHRLARETEEEINTLLCKCQSSMDQCEQDSVRLREWGCGSIPAKIEHILSEARNIAATLDTLRRQNVPSDVTVMKL